jgi:hypothetical protein
VNVVGLSDEGGGDVVDFVLDTPVDDVVDVLLREGGKIDDDSWKVLYCNVDDIQIEGLSSTNNMSTLKFTNAMST